MQLLLNLLNCLYLHSQVLLAFYFLPILQERGANEQLGRCLAVGHGQQAGNIPTFHTKQLPPHYCLYLISRPGQTYASSTLSGTRTGGTADRHLSHWYHWLLKKLISHKLASLLCTFTNKGHTSVHTCSISNSASLSGYRMQVTGPINTVLSSGAQLSCMCS